MCAFSRLVIILQLLVYCNNSCESRPSSPSVSFSGVPGGSGDNSLAFYKSDNDIKNGNGNELSTATRIARRSLGDDTQADFKSLLLHELENSDEPKPNDQSLTELPEYPEPNQNSGLSDIAKLTSLIGKSLKALEFAAELASNSTAYLQQMLATVEENSNGMIQQLETMKHLSHELSKEVAKPLSAIEPLVETQIEFARTISSSVMKLIDQISDLENKIVNLITIAPFLLISSLSGNLLSLIILLCLLCTCRNIKGLRGKARKNSEPIYSSRSQSSQRPSIHQPLPYPFRTIEMDEQNLRNSLRTQF